jgi:hypothetical protein
MMCSACLFKWCETPAHKVSKYLGGIICQYMCTSNILNTHNFISLINELITIDRNQHTKLCCDIINMHNTQQIQYKTIMYNIPKLELLQIIQHVFIKQCKLFCPIKQTNFNFHIITYKPKLLLMQLQLL